MRVQWKLFVMLFVVGVLPLVLVASVSLRAARDSGQELAGELRRELTDMISSQLQRDVRAASTAVQRGVGTAEAALRALTLTSERLLEQDIRTMPRVYYAKDYDTPGKQPADISRPPGYVRHGGDGPVAVSFGQMVFVNAPGVSRLETRADTARLARLLPVCRALFHDLGGTAYRMFVSLESGVTAAYPGFGGYPDRFDPRRASWYRRARESGGVPVWSELLVSRGTGMALYSFTSPVRGPDGSFAGVASVELPLTWFLQEAELASAWTERMHSFIVTADKDGGTGRAALHVLARRAYNEDASDLVGEAYQLLDSDTDKRAFQALADDILAGGSGTTLLEYEGEDCIWSYAPLDRKGMAFVLVVPTEVAGAGSQRIEESTENIVSVQWLVTYAAAVVLAFAAAVAAYLFSRRGAAVTEAMVRAWKRLAGGDFEVRMSLRTGDERDDLVAAFNETVPKLAERVRLKHSVSLAREVQQGLLPEELPQVPGLDVAGVTLYCDETGGDWYDVIQTSREGSLLVAVADVSGHDVASALLMASTRAFLRSAAHGGRPLAERVAAVNRLVTADVAGSGRFVTMFCLEYQAGSGDITWVRAGHESGWLFEPDGADPEELGGEGLALGFKATGVCAEGRRMFSRPDSLVVLCTDGVLETVNPEGELFGRERMLQAVRSALKPEDVDAGAVVRAVVETLDAFRASEELSDDVSILVLRRTAGG